MGGSISGISQGGRNTARRRHGALEPRADPAQAWPIPRRMEGIRMAAERSGFLSNQSLSPTPLARPAYTRWRRFDSLRASLRGYAPICALFADGPAAHRQ